MEEIYINHENTKYKKHEILFVSFFVFFFFRAFVVISAFHLKFI